LQRARDLYADHGAKMLFAARFMPGIRSAMFLSAGVFGVPFWKFFLIDGIAAMFSVPLWIWAGAKFSGHAERILGGARMATAVIVTVLVSALIIWGIWEYKRIKKEPKTLGPDPLPGNESGRREAEDEARLSRERPSETSIAG
jgi:membrane protein DedA with SNARE-associated domain